MSTDEQDGRKDGSPAHSFGNTLAWNWSREMPRYLKGGFLTAMYACRAMASANGRLCFKDGKAIRIQDMAKAFGCREQDARRYLEAAIRAGLVHVEGERRRGVATVYMLNAVIRHPDWKAAEAYLKGTARRPKEDEETTKGSGHSGTNSDGDGTGHSGTNQFGPQRHELDEAGEEEVRSTVDRPGSGHSGTTGSVHSGSNNPGVSHGVPHDMADVGTQPQPVAREDDQTDRSSSAGEILEDLPFGRCEGCHKPLMHAGRTRCGVCRRLDALPGQGRATDHRKPVQRPLMSVVPTVLEGPAAAGELFRWKPDDPLAPARTCGCGREFRSRADASCQDCQYAAHQEASTA
ncbi:hypothetical protein ACIOHS_26850 [Streptomyces sp. NPDC088253]|uniref:hypothetical protein n=1 Tax=Streptomyces sp. NPDC088253 TaxID=3365846 RepID=UPI0037FA0957